MRDREVRKSCKLQAQSLGLPNQASHGLVGMAMDCHAGDPGSNLPTFRIFFNSFLNVQGVQNGCGGIFNVHFTCTMI